MPQPSVNSRATRSYRAGDVLLRRLQQHPGRRSAPPAPGGALTRESSRATSHVAYDPLDDPGIATVLGQGADGPGLLEAGISIDALGGRVADVATAATAFVHREALATVQYTATYPPGTADARPTGSSGASAPRWCRTGATTPTSTTPTRPSRTTEQAYFGANAARLAQVRATYDPHGFFTQPQDY